MKILLFLFLFCFQFACCGVSEKGFRDWSNNPYFNCTTGNPSPEKCAVPYSCCIQEKKGVSRGYHKVETQTNSL